MKLDNKICKSLATFTLLTILLTIHMAGSTKINANSIIGDSELPLLWAIDKIIAVPNEQLPTFSQKLGGEITSISNYFIDACGLKIQVNIINAATEAEASNIHANIVKLTGNAQFYKLRGTSIFEFRGNNIFVIEKMKDILNLNDQEPVRYKVKFSVAPLKEIKNEMEWNRFCNLLVSFQTNPDNAELKSEIAKLKENFVFDTDISLRTIACAEERYQPQYQFSTGSHPKEPDKVINQNHSNTYIFSVLEQIVDLPVVTIEAAIPVGDFTWGSCDLETEPEAFLGQTEYWPVNNSFIQAIVEQNITEQLSTEAKVEHLLSWMKKNVQYGGEVGSRYGVEQVLEQKYGRCMDMADLLITLSRAADIPARMILGWHTEIGGHAWVEVLIPEKGWLAVDATTTWTGVSNRYIPLVISEDGQIPFVYWSFPQIEILN